VDPPRGGKSPDTGSGKDAPGDDQRRGFGFSPKTVFAAIATGMFAFGGGQQVNTFVATAVAAVVFVLVLKHLRGK
jgi:hypothetical protein